MTLNNTEKTEKTHNKKIQKGHYKKKQAKTQITTNTKDNYKKKTKHKKNTQKQKALQLKVFDYTSVFNL